MSRNYPSTAGYAVKSIMILALAIAAFFFMPTCSAFADAEGEAQTFLWEDSMTVYVGESKDNSIFNAYIKSVKSANPSIATVKRRSDQPEYFDVTGKKAGKTTITVKTDNNKTLKCKITVKAKAGTKTKTETIKKNYMKNLKGISWDLKTNGKWFTYQTKYAGIGMRTQRAKITKWKVRTAPTDVKFLTFRVTIDPQWKVTKSQVHKMTNSADFNTYKTTGGNCGYWVVDYATGENLEAEGNNYSVEVSDTGWHVAKTKTFKDDHGCYVNFRTVYTDVTVSYYPGTVLAVGVTGSTSLGQTSGYKSFLNGKAPFGKTTCYSKTNKKVAHFKTVK